MVLAVILKSPCTLGVKRSSDLGIKISMFPMTLQVLLSVTVHCTEFGDCDSNPVVFWDCSPSMTPGDCCEQTLGLYGDQASGGFRIY